MQQHKTAQDDIDLDTDLGSIQRTAIVNQHKQKIAVHEGLMQLKTRQQRLVWGQWLAGVALLCLVVFYFAVPNMIYAYFDLPTVQALHIPVTTPELLDLQQPNYVNNFFSWLLWFSFKLFGSIIGAVILIKILKKLRFFQKKIVGFFKHILAFLLSMMLIWSAMTSVQYFSKDYQAERKAQQYYAYQNNIQESQIYQKIQQNQIEKLPQAYVLAQVAVLHQPLDKAVATAYLQQLQQAEQQGGDFYQYGFQAEKIWQMQKQVYGSAVTPLAQSIDVKAQRADKILSMVQIVMGLMMAIVLALTALYWLLARQFSNRIKRIEQILKS
ncbi:hypothetical protein [Acinetobacter sp. c3-l95]